MERRADEVISGKVKGIPWEEFEKDLKKMRKSITPKLPRDLEDEGNAFRRDSVKNLQAESGYLNSADAPVASVIPSNFP